MSRFQRAARQAVPLKLALMGVSGSGKTYSAIRLAHGLAGGDPDKILVLDTENESAALYSHLNGGFLHEAIRPPFVPRTAISLIRDAAKEGIAVVVLDSASHFWEYILSYKEELDRKGGNSYTNWGKAKPLFRELKDALLQSPVHVICCMRAKADYAIEETEQNGNRRSSVKKLGTSAIAEPGLEYEFSVVWLLDRDTNMASVEKDRTSLFQGKVETITEEHGERLLAWLGVEAGTGLKAGEDWARIAAGESDEFKKAHAEMEASKGGVVEPARAALGFFNLGAPEIEDLKSRCKAIGLTFSQWLVAARDAGDKNHADLDKRLKETEVAAAYHGPRVTPEPEPVVAGEPAPPGQEAPVPSCAGAEPATEGIDSAAQPTPTAEPAAPAPAAEPPAPDPEAAALAAVESLGGSADDHSALVALLQDKGLPNPAAWILEQVVAGVHDMDVLTIRAKKVKAR